MPSDPLDPKRLKSLYNRLNRKHFANQLPVIPIVRNDRLLTTCAQVGVVWIRPGRMAPVDLQMGSTWLVDVAHNTVLDGMKHTALEWLMLHEMTHIFLITTANMCGHTPLFNATMSSITGCVCKHTHPPW